VRLDDGRRVPIEALYVVPRTRPASPLAEQLGCAFDDGPLGPVLRVDAMKMSTVPGVYAAGDAAMAFTNATLASADGLMAAVSMHRSLVFGS
jgi:thioredoxin reductase